MSFTYTGPSVSAAFVAGLFNDSWDVAAQQSARLDGGTRRILGGTNTAMSYIGNKVGNDKAPHMKLVFDPSFLRDLTPDFQDGEAGEQDAAADELRAHLQQQLRGMLRTFILNFFPFYQIPDGSDAWERVAATFDNQKLEGGIDLVRQRVTGAWAERGITIPAAALGAQYRFVEKAVADANVQSPRNQELIRLRELKGMDLIRYEQVNRQQIEALEAAKAFLLSTLLPMSRKVSEDQDRLTNYKRDALDAYYRYMGTLIDADEKELDRLVYERGIAVDRQMTTDQRKLQIFQAQMAVLGNEMTTIAQRASAAIARLGVELGFSGSEQQG